MFSVVLVSLLLLTFMLLLPYLLLTLLLMVFLLQQDSPAAAAACVYGRCWYPIVAEFLLLLELLYIAVIPAVSDASGCCLFSAVTDVFECFSRLCCC